MAETTKPVRLNADDLRCVLAYWDDHARRHGVGPGAITFGDVCRALGCEAHEYSAAVYQAIRWGRQRIRNHKRRVWWAKRRLDTRRGCVG